MRQPRPRINVIHLGSGDEAIHDRSALPTTVAAGEEPRLSAQGNAAQPALSRIVGHANAAVIKETG
jgi:hypothetical protein